MISGAFPGLVALAAISFISCPRAAFSADGILSRIFVPSQAVRSRPAGVGAYAPRDKQPYSCISATLLILLSRYWLKMLRVHAASDAALVVQFQAFRYWANEQFVADSMGGIDLVPFNSDLSVSLFFHNIGGPKPAAGVWFRRDLIQKSFEKLYSCGRHLIPLKSDRLGLREAGNFVAARSYFTLFSIAGPIVNMRTIACL